MLLADESRDSDTGLDVVELENLALGQLESAVEAGFANPERLNHDKAWIPLQEDERFALIKNSLLFKK